VLTWARAGHGGLGAGRGVRWGLLADIWRADFGRDRWFVTPPVFRGRPRTGSVLDLYRWSKSDPLWDLPARGVSREERVLTVEDWAEGRRLHRAEGKPIKAIARTLGISRNTVRAALASGGPPKVRAISPPPTATTPATLSAHPASDRIHWPAFVSIGVTFRRWRRPPYVRAFRARGRFIRVLTGNGSLLKLEVA
jgi:hypothetical protein